MATPSALPTIIQGGMGIAVSNWRLANAVSRLGQLGVVSGTGIDAVLVRRLQDGDPDGAVRRALARFPDAALVRRTLDRYFRPEGRPPGTPYRRVPLPTGPDDPRARDLTVLGSFVEVFLAREGHSGRVGLNLLTKLQLHTLPALYGAMLAQVDAVLMGAGIPREIPAVLDRLAAGEAASLRLDVTGEPDGTMTRVRFDPSAYATSGVPLVRPAFLPIVSSNVLAASLARRAAGGIQGFVVEGPTAGGHNAPPRGTPLFDPTGQPVYGERDAVDLGAMRALGLPFWLAGGQGTPEALERALAQGAAGIQVGTLFAYCEESGFEPELKRRVLNGVRAGAVGIFTDPRASPTGFPFKVAGVAGTLSEPEVVAARPRVCDAGYLREAYRIPDGTLGFRCPAEPVEQYVAKGGDARDTAGRLCLCNALLASAGFAQHQRTGGQEPPLVTSGDDLLHLPPHLTGLGRPYRAEDVIAYLDPRPRTGTC